MLQLFNNNRSIEVAPPQIFHYNLLKSKTITSISWLLFSILISFSGCITREVPSSSTLQRLIDVTLKPNPFQWDNFLAQKPVLNSNNGLIYRVSLNEVYRNAIVLGKEDRYTCILDNPGDGKLEFWGVGIAKSSSNIPSDLYVKISLRNEKKQINEIIALKCVNSQENPWIKYEIPVTQLGGSVECSMELALDPDVHSIKNSFAIIGSPIFVPDDIQTLPNVIFVCIDSLRADELGAYGSPHAITPTMDLVSKQGILFSQSLSTSCWTLPSVKNFLSGYETMQEQAEGEKLIPEKGFSGQLLQELYAEAGYSTLAVIANPVINTNIGFERGFDMFDLQASLDWRQGSSRAILQRIFELVEDYPNRPIFLYVHFMDPHDPHLPDFPFDRMREPPPDEAVRKELSLKYTGILNRNTDLLPLTAIELDYLRTYYRNEIRETDTIIHSILSTLSQYTGYPENTLLILISDHGEEFGEHGFYQHGMSLYESVTKVPWIMSFPSSIPLNHVETGWVSTMDIPPTIAGLTLNTHIPSWQGRQVFPKQPDYPSNRQIFTAVRAWDDTAFPRERWRAVYRNEKKLVWHPLAIRAYDLNQHPEEVVLFQFPSFEMLADSDRDSEWKSLANDLKDFNNSLVKDVEPEMPHALFYHLKELGYVH